MGALFDDALHGSRSGTRRSARCAGSAASGASSSSATARRASRSSRSTRPARRRHPSAAREGGARARPLSDDALERRHGLPAAHDHAARSSTRASRSSTTSSRSRTSTTATETCPRCSAEMEWRHGTFQCPKCRFKLDAVKARRVTAGIRARLEELEQSGLDPRSSELPVVLCWLVQDDIADRRRRVERSSPAGDVRPRRRRRPAPRPRARLDRGRTARRRARHAGAARRSSPRRSTSCPRTTSRPSPPPWSRSAPIPSSPGARSRSRCSPTSSRERVADRGADYSGHTQWPSRDRNLAVGRSSRGGCKSRRTSRREAAGRPRACRAVGSARAATSAAVFARRRAVLPQSRLLRPGRRPCDHRRGRPRRSCSLRAWSIQVLHGKQYAKDGAPAGVPDGRPRSALAARSWTTQGHAARRHDRVTSSRRRRRLVRLPERARPLEPEPQWEARPAQLCAPHRNAAAGRSSRRIRATSSGLRSRPPSSSRTRARRSRRTCKSGADSTRGSRSESRTPRSYPQGAFGSEFLGLLGQISQSRSSSPTRTRMRSPAKSSARAVSRRRTTRSSTQVSCRRRSPSTRSAESPAPLQRPARRSSRRRCSSRSTRASSGRRGTRCSTGWSRRASTAIRRPARQRSRSNPWTGAIKAIVSYPTFNQKLAANKPSYLAGLYQPEAHDSRC